MENPKQPNINIRLLAVRALSDINRNGAYANITLQKYIAAYELGDLDRRFFTELVYGTIRRRNYLDAIIEHLSKRRIKKLSSMVVEILRIGIYQLIYMDKVPESAAVNESVKLGKKLTKGLAPFINAILRNVIRQRQNLGITELATTAVDTIALMYNQPKWLVESWLKEYGQEDTETLCAWFNETPKLTARVNTLVCSVDECLKEMEEACWEVEPSTKLPEGIIIKKHTGSLEQSKWYVKGMISFMDEASMVVSHIVNPKPGEAVLDCCAAPGGKTMHLAALMKNHGQIIAGDIHEHKVALLKENAERLKVKILEAVQHDASNLPDSYKEKFDKVLVDAPCSGLGILQKKLDMRWRKTEAELENLPKIQLDILNSAARTVKKGGVLVYSTCTINKAENSEVVDKFLSKNPQFKLERAYNYMPFPTDSSDLTIQLLPSRDKMDGFFMARMARGVE